MLDAFCQMTNVFITAESTPHPAKVGQQGRRTVFAEITLLPLQKRDWQSMLFHTDSELVNTLACVSKKNTKNNLQLSMIFTVISLLHLPVMKITCFRLLHSTPAPLRKGPAVPLLFILRNCPMTRETPTLQSGTAWLTSFHGVWVHPYLLSILPATEAQ